jgi:hypothetical protein
MSTRFSGIKVNGQGGPSGNAADWHSGGAWFKSRPGRRPSRLRLLSWVSSVFQTHYYTLFTIYCYHFFRPSVVWVTDSVFKLQKKKSLGRTNRLLSLIRHGPHWKRRVQQLFYCCVCIRYRGKVSAEPLPSKDKGIFTESFPTNNRGGTYAHTHTQIATWSHKPTLFFQAKESRREKKK